MTLFRPGKKTILIADDEPSLRLLVTATIASDQIDVLEAADGDEAWSSIVQHHPDLVLLDVQMPGQTGVELTRRIRAHPSLTGMRIVILTSKAQAADAGGRRGFVPDQAVLAALAAHLRRADPRRLGAGLGSWVLGLGGILALSSTPRPPLCRCTARGG